MRINKIRILILAILMLALSCSSIQLPVDLTKKYKLNLGIQNKEFYDVGMIVLPKKPLYSIIFDSDGKQDFLSFKTCSREMIILDGKRLLTRKQVQINYSPNEIEQNRFCPSHIDSISEGGYMEKGYIDYENDQDILNAKVICAEKTEEKKGVSVCQSRVGTIQKIEFDNEVIVSPGDGCKNIRSENGNWTGKGFVYNIELDFCVYLFMEKKVPRRTHRLTTYGYNDILIKR
ncbi:MAG: hypothetical protein ACP5N7_01085 [Candidatus Pacearchaeota archaeon]